MPAVRQPLEPVPFRKPPLVGEHRHPQLVRGVKGDQLPDHRPDKPDRRVDLPGQFDAGEVPHRDGDGDPADGLVGADEAAQRDRRERFEVLNRLGFRRHELKRRTPGAQADPDPAEVLMAAAAFPQPGTGRNRPKLARVGVVPQQGCPLIGRRLDGLLAQLAQVAQVVAALGTHPPPAVRAGPAELSQAHAEHGGAHHPREQVSGRRWADEGIDHRHGSHAQSHRQVREHGTGIHDRRLGQHRRRRKLHPAVRCGRSG